MSNEILLLSPVLVVEDDPMMQQRLQHLLLTIGYQPDELFFAQSIAQAKSIFDRYSIGFCLVDLGLPDGHGRDFIGYARLEQSDIPILVISAWSTQDDILTAIQAGATGYLLKERDDFELMLSLRSILRGGAPIDAFIAQQILSRVVFDPVEKIVVSTSDVHLSPREQQVLEYVAQGLSNKAIAEQLQLSQHTVESHIKHIYRKLAVCTRTEAVGTARSLGLL